jgi:serine/threonine protein kinase
VLCRQSCTFFTIQVNIGETTTENEMLLLEREINLHTVIDHPHIIKLWDTLIDQNMVYMIMELAENGTLFAYQNKNQAISEAETFKFFSQTLSAIKYMHANDIMHRDLKVHPFLFSPKIYCWIMPST